MPHTTTNAVVTEIRDTTGWITLNRPEVHNAFNDGVIAELTAAFNAMAADDAVRCVMLAAEGKSFSAGADLNWMQAMAAYTEAENLADARRLYQLMHAIRHCPKPVIARVQGAAYGGGMGLIAACDLAVAVSSAQFALTEVKLGLIPAVISPFVVERIGSAARRLFVTAEPIDATEAQRLGLLDAVVDNETALDDWIATRADSIANNAPQAVAEAKQLATSIITKNYDDEETHVASWIARRRCSDEAQSRIKAFLKS